MRMRTSVVGVVVSVVATACGTDGGSGTAAGPTDPTDPTDTVDVEQVSGDEPDVTASALDDMFDPSFPEPLVDPARILSGGPPPDGIPPIDDPVYQGVDTVDWLADNEPVLLLEFDGEARVYPVQIMTWHEIVNDTVAATPLTVSFCPLCNSAVAYLRTVEDRVLDFGTSGRLYNSALVMYDRQTESLWSHFTGQAVVGTLTGTELELVPLATVSWLDARTARPDALVLTRDTGHSRDYGRNPYAGYDDIERSPFLFDGEVDGRLAAMTRVVVVRDGDDTVAVTLDHLSGEGVVTTEVDGREVVVLWRPGTSSSLDDPRIVEGRDIGATGVFEARLGGEPVELSPAAGTGVFVDEATGSVWDITGQALEGPRAGERLTRVEHLDTFWFAIAAFAPDTRIISSG